MSRATAACSIACLPVVPILKSCQCDWHPCHNVSCTINQAMTRGEAIPQKATSFRRVNLSGLSNHISTKGGASSGIKDFCIMSESVRFAPRNGRSSLLLVVSPMCVHVIGEGGYSRGDDYQLRISFFFVTSWSSV